jgi:hypothetical protein
MPVPENVTTAQQAAQGAEATAADYTSGQFQIGDILRQKTLDYLKANQYIVKPLDVAQSEYLSAPSTARQMYLTPGGQSQLRDPFAAEQLVSKYVAEKSLPMLSLSSILGQRFGRIEDFIGAGTRAYQAQSATALANAQAKRQTAQDLLNQWIQEETFRLRQEEINKPSGSGTNITISGLNIPGVTTGNITVQLIDPKTTNVYGYEGTNDPDYQADRAKGYLPINESTIQQIGLKKRLMQK